MNNTFIFIRHGKTEVDKSRPIREWDLAEQGKKEAESLTEVVELMGAEIFYSSKEPKSYQTLMPLVKKLNKNITQIQELGEIHRTDAHKITKEQYEERKNKLLADLSFTENGWERARNALKRFRKAIERIDRKNENKRIVICAHGTVLTLYFAYLKKNLKDIQETLGFGSYAIVKNGKIIKDFSREK